MERLIFASLLILCAAKSAIYADMFRLPITDSSGRVLQYAVSSTKQQNSSLKLLNTEMYDDKTLKTAYRNASLLKEAARYGMQPDDFLAIVDSALQSMTVLHSGSTAKVYRISTSRYGIGNKYGSNCTPPGWHKSAERYGDERPVGSVFSSRRFTGQILTGDMLCSSDGDLVLTRIIWLKGLQNGINRGSGIDSHERCIYIHGTNQEHLLGSPASHGCIRMKNTELVDFFEETKKADIYFIII